MLNGRYERVRQEGVVRSRALLLAVGVNGDGWRSLTDAGARALQSSQGLPVLEAPLEFAEPSGV